MSADAPPLTRSVAFHFFAVPLPASASNSVGFSSCVCSACVHVSWQRVQQVGQCGIEPASF